MPVEPPNGISDSEFYQQMLAEDPLGVVIRGVIYIESELIALANEAVVHPSAIKAMGLDYSGRVAFCISLGLTEDLGPPLNALGTLRNKFAHRPNMAVGKQEVDSIYNALSAEHRQLAQASLDRTRAKMAAEHRKFRGLSEMDQLRLLIVTLRQAVRVARHEIDRQRGESLNGAYSLPAHG